MTSTIRNFVSRTSYGMAVVCCLFIFVFPAKAETIIDEWPKVEIPPTPELKKVTVDPKTTVLLVMGFVRDSCNAQRRPRCAATSPAVANFWPVRVHVACS